MRALETRAAVLRCWPDVTGLERIAPPELQAVEAVVAHEVSRPVPGVLRALYGEPLTSEAIRWGDVGAVADALRWRRVAAPADALWERKRENAREIGEPVWVPVARDEPEEAPEGILTEQGWMRLEDEYLPRVCAGEHLYAHPEAKAALVIAARTYVLRAMRDHPQLGRTEPVKNSEKFQVFARAASSECVEAARRTTGIVLRYGGRLILANYVAGALWKADGSRGKDSTDTEKFVTYNAGRRGEDVIPTRLALRGHPGNRGCLSQNGAHWLAEHGWDHAGILRFFYGEDVELVPFGGRGGLLGLAALVVLGVAMVSTR
jgi:hypothetical protein